MVAIEPHRDGGRPLPFHHLVYLADGDEVTIGRPDIDSYGIFPRDGAELVRRLADGTTPDEAARWYESEYGESADIDDVLAALDELGFIRGVCEAPVPPGPVRWQWLGRAVFSPVAWLVYGALVVWAVVAMAGSSRLVPTYHDIFFTKYVSVIELALLVAAVPLLLLHEIYHTLAARRLGLRSRLRVSQRLYYLVMETSMDGLVAVPRRKRYLPILAGMLFDTVAFACTIVAAQLSRNADGTLSYPGRLCMAAAFTILVRLLWQLYFYARTDLYVLINTVLGCVDLHTTSTRVLRNRVNRLLGRRDRLMDESEWHPADRRAARWYSWLIVVGYAVSLATLILALGPATVHLFAGALGRFGGGTATARQLLDSALFVAFNVAQIALTVWLGLRERARRRATALHHVID